MKYFLKVLPKNFLIAKSRILQYLNLLQDLFFKHFGLREKFSKNVFENTDMFEWRGLHLDLARHAFSEKYLFELVEKMQNLYLNKLHLHLSDDQGFRMEIKKWPRLHEVGSVRRETVVGKNFVTPWNPIAKYLGDGKVYGKYYTQDFLKKLVKHAKSCGVEIIPEIDIPGHATAMLVAYPEFSAGVSPTEVSTYWGVLPNVLNHDLKTINFLKDIFHEVCEVFDSEYVHVGGDEVPLENYGGSEARPKAILRELISYINSLGKKAIVWDEAAPLIYNSENLAMVWRDCEIGKEILKNNGKIILCPNEFFYFDYYQKNPSSEPLAIGGYLPIDKVYNFNYEEIFREEKKYWKNILGVQANVWTEYIKDEKHLNYMLYPRLYALSHVTQKTNTDFEKFSKNLTL